MFELAYRIGEWDVDSMANMPMRVLVEWLAFARLKKGDGQPQAQLSPKEMYRRLKTGLILGRHLKANK